MRAATFEEFPVPDMFLVAEDDGRTLDARFTVEGHDLIFHSRGGVKGKDAINADYGKGLLLLVGRLSRAGVPLVGAWVDSTTVQSLPIEARAILSRPEGSWTPEQICGLLSSRMKDVRRGTASAPKGGNATKRIRISTGFIGSPEGLAQLLKGVPAAGDFRSQNRLPAEMLNRVTPEYIWAAVQQFLSGGVQHTFGPSTDFDLIADDGHRLPPKAVFGVALSLALDGEPIGPKHFSGGETSACFRLLRDAGYQVVSKEFLAAPPNFAEGEDIAQEWREGLPKLVSHLMRERAPGLSKAKKAQYRRKYGKLMCECCHLDPVEHYKTENAEACIEVHHAAVHVSDMPLNHKTTLDDLQCLCANCHRLVHKILSAKTECL